MYKIGQEVVCVKTHSQGIVEEGKIYVIDGFKTSCCSGELLVDVGIKATIKYTLCGELAIIGETYNCADCRKLTIYDGKWWLCASLFRPLDDLFNKEIEELMNEINEREPFTI